MSLLKSAILLLLLLFFIKLTVYVYKMFGVFILSCTGVVAVFIFALSHLCVLQEGNNPQGSSQGVKITEQPKKSSFFRCTILWGDGIVGIHLRLNCVSPTGQNWTEHTLISLFYFPSLVFPLHVLICLAWRLWI